MNFSILHCGNHHPYTDGIADTISRLVSSSPASMIVAMVVVAAVGGLLGYMWATKRRGQENN